MSSAQPTVSYPSSYSAGQGPYVAPPPPAGYPTMDASAAGQTHNQVETKSKGDGFWKGCCAAICCCCVLDACF
ncbi:protein CYSTEINE-RICH TRANSMEMBRANE MODULE 9-like [Humulus lupulus]|uniref:protein CYSTEINE-RICH TRANSMEMBRANE MODULE 9-like n=1 Tax=Humulus lupulus TaxID=3486 RepID=UPI002B4056BD|nr:protein CYSTEINE-RICH TRANSMEMBRANE MODULE 9-like [Humulus lupulus]XP_062107034.1 protein CYSTEINE-RICH TRANSMEMBRANE MODULE 9-like [Humulus lupulus]